MINIYVNSEYQYYPDSLLNPVLRTCKNINRVFPTSLVSYVSTLFNIVDKPENADLCFLPLNWNYYNDNNQIQQARELFLEANSAKKKFVIFSHGDYTANISFPNVIILEYSSYRSRNYKNGIQRLAIPVFVDDYINLYNGGNVTLRKKTNKPVIGFCGQANGSKFDFIRRNLTLQGKKVLFTLGLQKWEPPVFEPTLFRQRILQKLSENENLTTNFILRTKYRAGYTKKDKDPYHKTRLEFANNILNTDYTVCMRGAGNFSARFYETLSCGKMPIFIDTDCILPFEKFIDYKKFCVFVNQNELDFIGEIILDYHSSLSESDFFEMQIRSRKVWEEFFTKEGFYRNLARELKDYC